MNSDRSRRLLRVAAACLWLFVGGGATISGKAPAPGDSIRPALKAITLRINQLKDSAERKAVLHILEEILGLGIPPRKTEPQEFAIARDIKLRLLLRLYQAVDRQIDPTFDPVKDFPKPPGNGINLGQPATQARNRRGVPDVQEEKRKQATRQIMLRRDLAFMTPFLFALMKAGYDAKEQSRLDNLLKDEIPDDALRAKLDSQYAKFQTEYDAVMPGVAFKKEIPKDR